MAGRISQQVIEVLVIPQGGQPRVTQMIAEALIYPVSESLHRLDIALDTQKSDWQWIQELASLYRSTVIHSNGQYKIITDRADLPVRQVFHAGNIERDSVDIREITDQENVNQAVIEFANKDLDYERDVRYLTNSEALITNDPLKPFNLAVQGISRESEAKRIASLSMQRRQQRRREVSFVTGLEAIHVEAGDVAVVGNIVTDLEGGIGGRIIDGGSSYAILDRPLDMASGYTYDMWLWHVEADTPEIRTVSSGAGNMITVRPTSAFDYAARPNDRYAIGITSEDLMKVRVMRVERQPDGRRRLAGEQYIPITPDLDCPSSTFTGFDLQRPSQPRSLTTAVSMCIVCVRATQVSCHGGMFTLPGSIDGTIWLASSPHNPNTGSLIGDSLTIVGGVNSGYVSQVLSYIPYPLSGRALASIEPFFASVPESGVAYRIAFNTSMAGFGVEALWNNVGSAYQPVGEVLGNSGCVDVAQFGSNLSVRITPFNQERVENLNGRWVTSLIAPGCDNPADISVVTTANMPWTAAGSPLNVPAFTGGFEQPFYGVTLAGSSLLDNGAWDINMQGLLTDVCSDSEYTEMRLRWLLGTRSLSTIRLMLNGSGAAVGIGQDQGFNLVGRITPVGPMANGAILATLQYQGPSSESGSIVIGTTIQTSLNLSQIWSMGFRASFLHFATGSSDAHSSHPCFSLVHQRTTFVIDEGS